MELKRVPKIATAIPQKRFQYGDYGVTILGDIDSNDGVEYRFVAAFVADGAAHPMLYVTAQRQPPGQRAAGQYGLHVINAALDEVMDQGDQWRDLAAFTEQALKIGSQLLGLEQENPYPLM